MITAIEVTNWKTHKNTRIDFQKGVNVMIGVMGAGKSSIMDAISFGLFGTFPALTSKRVSLANLISNRPKSADQAEVKLDFNVDGEEYTVTRKITEKGSEAKLEKNGKYVQTQATKVTEEIENLLKIDYDTFARAIYSEQNRLDYFLELRKSERKVQIDHMLGLDQFATAEENATSLVNSVKSTISYDEETLAQIDIKELESKLDDSNAEIQKMQKEQDKFITNESALKTEIEKIRKELDELKKLQQKKKGTSDEIVKIKSRIATLNEQIKKIDLKKFDEKSVTEEIKEIESKYKSLKKGADEQKETNDKLTKEIGALENSIESNEKKIKERDRLVKEAKGEAAESIAKKLEEENKLMQELVDSLAKHKSKRSDIDESIRELKKHVSKCPVCERDMDPELRNKLLDKNDAMAKSIEDEIKKADKSASDKNIEIKTLNQLHVRLTSIRDRLKDYADLDSILEKERKQFEKSRKELNELSTSSEKASKELEEVRNLLNDRRTMLENVKRRSELEAQVEKEGVLLESKTKEFDKIDVDDKTIDSLQEKFTKESSSLSGISTNIINGKKFIDNLDLQIKEREKQIKSFRTTEAKIEKKRNQLNNLNKFKAALIETETLLRNRLVGSINVLMQNLWPEIYPYADYSSLRLDAKKDDYQLEVNAIGTGAENWISVDSVASGGERSTACLTMRIALSMVIVPNLKWLILDEPTHNIDSTGITKMIEVLGNSLPNFVEQIFIITHDEELKQINAAKVYLLDRDKAKNASTVASEI